MFPQGREESSHCHQRGVNDLVELANEMNAGTSPNDESLSWVDTRARAFFEIFLILLLFFIHGAWPVPEVNEAHYLGKAKNYWNPEWCAKDFFCGTANAHPMFYWTFGWLTLWLPLPAVAWVGRLLTWSLLAWAWRRLSAALAPERFAAVLSAGLFLALLHRGHLAGEWVVGGVEAKGFAFVLGLLGIEAVVRDRWNWAWLCFGAAAAFHVLVGGWLVVAAGIAWWILQWSGDETSRDVHPWALVAGGLLALPGLIPAVMLTRGVDPAVASEAVRIYVHERLPHHLVPQTFPWYFLLRFAAMAALWLVIAWRIELDGAGRRLAAIVHGSLAIATAGLAIGFAAAIWPEQVDWLLRYYWFRTADVLLPLGLGLALTMVVVRKLRQQRPAGIVWLTMGIFAVGGHLGTVLHERLALPIPPADRKMRNFSDWRQTCVWVAARTPRDAVFLTPRLASTFRWYTHRAEVVSWKDIPQDAVGIVEWWRRLCDVHHRVKRGPLVCWRSSLSEAPPEELVRLAKEYDAQYLITEALPPLPFELVSPPNDSYAVYRLPKTWEARKPQAN